MKAIYRYIFIMLCSVALAQCNTPVEIPQPENAAPGNGNSAPEDNDGTGNDDKEYTSYWYYSYEAEQLLTAESLGIQKEQFMPYTVAHRNDTLFIANIARAEDLQLILYSLKENRMLTTLRSWQFQGREMKFDSENGNKLDVILPVGDRLYVAEKKSRIHVFRLPSLEYISCIGDGNWSREVFEAQAMIEHDGLLFARDKDSKISIYKADEATPQNYEKVKRYRRAAGTGSSNNGFQPHNMVLDEKGNIVMTEYDAKKIRTLNPALVTEQMQNGESIDIAERDIKTDFWPRTLALRAERMYVSGTAAGNRHAIFVYDRQAETWTKEFSRIKGYAFAEPARIYAQNDSLFWVSDTGAGKRTLVKMGVYKNEIREYERLDEHRIKVTGPRTRGDGPEAFVVDIRTHEILE